LAIFLAWVSLDFFTALFITEYFVLFTFLVAAGFLTCPLAGTLAGTFAGAFTGPLVGPLPVPFADDLAGTFPDDLAGTFAEPLAGAFGFVDLLDLADGFGGSFFCSFSYCSFLCRLLFCCCFNI